MGEGEVPEDLRGVRGAPAVPPEDHPCPLERGACWIPLGDYDLGVGIEDPTSVPQAGEILFYPGGVSETEILFPYAGTIFASKAGQLAGNHFLTVTQGRENLRALGEKTLWEGAQDILFERAS